MSRYRRTSSVRATFEELNWELLASRRRTARLVLFHKIHYSLVAINMPLELKHNSGPTQKTSWHITFLHHQLTIKRIHSSTAQSEIGTVFLAILSIQYSWTIQGFHRLRGSATPVLTATLHSYGSLAWLSDFFPPTALEVRPLNRFSRIMAQSTWIHARMCLLQ